MNLADLRVRLGWVLHFNPGQVEQSFGGESSNAPYFHLDYLLNAAGREEVSLGQLTYRQPFITRHPITWPASAVTLEIPPLLRGAQVLSIHDTTSLTSGQVGDLVGFGDESISPGGMYRYDTNTWAQSPAPSSERTYTVRYMARWQDLTAPGQEPTLIPADQHDLIVWNAACLGATVQSRKVDPAWVTKRDELRMTYQLLLSKGHPMVYPPGVKVLNSERFVHEVHS